MKKIIYLGIATFLVACLIYVIPQWNVVLSSPDNWWVIRKEFILFSGVVAWLFMTLAMVLSLRLPVIESVTNGLDKGFILHKWAGIITLVVGILHWLMEIVPKWIAQHGWIAAPLKGKHMAAGYTPDWTTELATVGQNIAEWAIYVMIILVIISLSKKIPYSFFRYVHKIFPLVYLFITFHALTVLVKTTWWSTPSSWVMVIVAVAGSIVAFISLFQHIGKKRKISAVVSRVERHGDTVDMTLQMDKPLYYRSGQFAFVHFGNNPEPHPYTIASSPDDPFNLRFVIKALGDDTRRLVETLSPGDKAEVEGPYGCFNFEHTFERQIWVAGGIGITPFLSKLTELAQQGGAKTPIDFWYCGHDEECERLQALCQKAKVRLHSINTRRQGRLSDDTLLQVILPGEKVGIWFCGPESFGQSLRRSMKRKYTEFQYEKFSLR